MSKVRLSVEQTTFVRIKPAGGEASAVTYASVFHGNARLAFVAVNNKVCEVDVDLTAVRQIREFLDAIEAAWEHLK